MKTETNFGPLLRELWQNMLKLMQGLFHFPFLLDRLF